MIDPAQGLSLDILANSASPPTQTIDKYEKDKKAFRKENRHCLRRAAGRILGHERVATCGQKTLGSFVSIHCHEGQACYGGLTTCSSVWMCPVCAVKITEGRRIELDQVLAAHQQEQGRAAMMTLTIPHQAFQRCRTLKSAVSNAWRKVKTGKAWQTARDRSAWIGDIRALEVTHGQNGWHPHLHILALFGEKSSDAKIQAFGEWVFSVWSKEIARLGFGQCDRQAFDCKVVTDHQGVAEYVGKWGVALELTKAHVKLAATGGRTPWQILADYQSAGEERDRRLFREYALAFKGSRQLTWSRAFKRITGEKIPSIRERYLSDPDVSDEDLCAAPTREETHQASLDKALFQIVAKRGLTAAILSAHEEGGGEAVKRRLRQERIPFYEQLREGLQPKALVPFFYAECRCHV